MAIPPVVFSDLDINDQTNYSILEGGTLGAPLCTYDVHRGFDGSVRQFNETTANLVTVSLPMFVYGSSTADVLAKVAALNTKIAGCSSAAPKTLTFDGVSFSIVSSNQVAQPLTQLYQNRYVASIDLVLNRLP